MLKALPSVALSLALTACPASLKPKKSDGRQATGTPATATAQDTGSTVDTAVLQIPAIDLDGLKTVTIDVGPLKGFSVQAPSGVDPATEINA